MKCVGHNAKLYLGIFILFFTILTIVNVRDLAMIATLDNDLKFMWGVLTLLGLLSALALIAKSLTDDGKKFGDIDTNIDA